MVWSGLTTADAMAAKRPYIIIGCFPGHVYPSRCGVAVTTAIPMWLLFEVGVMLARASSINETPKRQRTNGYSAFRSSESERPIVY